MIEINNLTKEKIDEKFLKKIAEAVLKGEGAEKENLSVVFVDEEKIWELNKKYRKQDNPTDVLSFKSKVKSQKSKLQLKTQKLLEKEIGLGEIIICPEIVKKNAKKFNLDYNRELAKVLIHGALHILGYDHEKSEREAEKMEKREKYYLSKI